MKLSAVAVPVLLASSVFASALTHRRAPNPLANIVAARQAKVSRGLVDVCVGLDVDLELLDILPGGKPLIAGHLDVCLCLSLLPDFCKSNPVAQAASLLVGETQTENIIRDLINNSKNKQQCTYPDHSLQICSGDWPCGFQCKDGYTPFTPPGSPHPTECVCAVPNMECNGQCGSFPKGCGSAVPYKKRAAPSCKPGRDVCGVLGGAEHAWECVDTTSDLESCGGCTVPSPFATTNVTTGVDCTAIPHASSVKCLTSSCVVLVCDPGFTPSVVKDACVAVGSIKRDILDAGLLETLGAEVGHIANIGEAGAAGLHVGRDIVDAGLLETLGAEVGHIAAIGEAGAAGLHVGRDILDAGLLEVVGADVKHIAKVGEVGAAGIHIGRDLAELGAVEAASADLKHVVKLGEGAGLGVKVARDLVDGLVVETLGAVVPGIAKVGEAGVAGVHVARDLVDAAVGAVAGAVVAPVAAAGVIADSGLAVL